MSILPYHYFKFNMRRRTSREEPPAQYGIGRITNDRCAIEILYEREGDHGQYGTTEFAMKWPGKGWRVSPFSYETAEAYLLDKRS